MVTSNVESLPERILLTPNQLRNIYALERVHAVAYRDFTAEDVGEVARAATTVGVSCYIERGCFLPSVRSKSVYVSTGECLPKNAWDCASNNQNMAVRVVRQ